jgi:tetratricopeptide (TPR) repeat protein
MALLRLAGTSNARGMILEGAEWSRKALAMAEALDDPTLRVLASFETGWSSMNLGDFEAGHEALRRSYELHQTDRDAALTYTYGIEPGPLALAWDGQTMWYLGYPEQALELADRGIDLARRIGHPYTLCHALAIGAASLRWICGQKWAALRASDESGAIAAEHHFPFWSAAATTYRGRAVGHLCDPQKGLALIAEGEAAWRAMGIRLGLWIPAAARAELEHHEGRSRRALMTVERAQTDLAATSERRGHLRLALSRGRYKRALGDPSAADALVQVINTARSMKARSIELLAATELALHFEAQDRLAEARAALEPIYTWFTEGHDTTALLSAASVLERL